MFEHMVRKVKVSQNNNGDFTLEYYYANSRGSVVKNISSEDIGAIETWLKQPKLPTPEERAKEVVSEWIEDNIRHKPYLEPAQIAALTERVAAEIRATESAARESGG